MVTVSEISSKIPPKRVNLELKTLNPKLEIPTMHPFLHLPRFSRKRYLVKHWKKKPKPTSPKIPQKTKIPTTPQRTWTFFSRSSPLFSRSPPTALTTRAKTQLLTLQITDRRHKRGGNEKPSSQNDLATPRNSLGALFRHLYTTSGATSAATTTRAMRPSML
jgi:hypothetical protein